MPGVSEHDQEDGAPREHHSRPLLARQTLAQDYHRQAHGDQRVETREDRSHVKASEPGGNRVRQIAEGTPCVRIVVTPSDQGISDRGLA